MREIKFRLRDRHNKIVGYEKWYTGSFRLDDPDKGLASGSGWWEASPCWLYSINGKRWTPTFIPHRYKDQYTGLKDKNGVEIYEGDIVRAEHHQGDKHFQGEVAWEEGGCGFVFGSMGECIEHWELEDIEVIGNIYENPEVLK